VPGFGRVRKGANHFDGATATQFIRVLRQPGESDIVDSPGMAQHLSALRRDDMGGIPQR